MLDTLQKAAGGSIDAAILGNCALVVSRDGSLAHWLQSWLRSSFGCKSRWLSDSRKAASVLEGEEVDTVFWDVRDPVTEDTASSLQQWSAKARLPRPLIAISAEEEIPDGCEIPAQAFHGVLRLPLEASRLMGFLNGELAGSLFSPTAALAEPFVIESSSFQYQTHSAEFHKTLTHLLTVAPHDVTVLLVGETGTGKTTLARMVHELSRRADGNLLTVPCGALPAELIESELFGHVRGAFTGADRDKLGKFEVAAAGTILLDEIDVLGPHQQAKLLRVIETGEYEPVGSHETRVSEARIVVATNEDLSSLMERNEFRSDLYYRLNVLEFHIPPLRKRPMDIIPLTIRFIHDFSTAHSVPIQRIHPDFLHCLTGYHWPGNIRELKNHVRRAVLFSQNGELTPYDLAPAIMRSAQKSADQTVLSGAPETLSEKVACSEQEILEDALRANNFRRAATAQALGISRVGLYKKMKKYGMLNLKRSN